MNLLFLTSSCIDPTRGGVQRISDALITYFRDEGVQVYIVSWKGNGFAKNLNQFYLPEESAIYTRKNLEYVSRLVKRLNINIIINQQGINILFMKLLDHTSSSVKIISVMHNSLLTHIRNYYYIHEYSFGRKHLKGLLRITKNNLVRKLLLAVYYCKYKKRISYIVEHSDNIVLLSEKLENELAFFVPRREYKDKLVIIPNFIIPYSSDKATIEDLLSKKKKRLLYVGRIDCSIKRIDTLFKIWSKLYKEYPEWELDVVGGNERDLTTLRQLVSRLKLERVNLIGFANPMRYYEEDAIYCMTSCAESFGMVLVEAMRCATVPIAFNSYPAITDIIDSGKNGILVDNMNVEEYAKSLSLLINNETGRSILAENAWKKSFTFSDKAILPKWKSLLNF